MRNRKSTRKSNGYVGYPTESQLKAQAWKELKAKYGITSTRGMVLHHIDPTLKTRDPVRYSQWNVKDLIPMPKAQHRSLHMRIEAKGRTRTETHNKRISETLKERNLRGKAILITMPAQAYVFKTLA